MKKIIVSKLLGSAEVEFLREGTVVHVERFKGEKSGPFERPIRTTEQFDAHRCRFVTVMPDDWKFEYEVVA